MTVLLAGVLLGLGGNVHCAAMCGPLVLAMAPRLTDRPRWPGLMTVFLYHAGRLSTYVALALPAGLAGTLLSVGGLGRSAALGGALVLLAIAFGPGVTNRLSHPAARRLASIAVCVGAGARRWRARHPFRGAFAAGVAHGVLPCGLVYAAVAASIAAGSVRDAGLMMLGFGVGTVPALAVFSTRIAPRSAPARAMLRRLRPVVLIAAAALMLARAFDLPEHGASGGSGHARHTSGAHR